MARVRSDSGRRLNQLWAVNAKHALYHRRGLWYEQLEEFPGALFDEEGYVLFASEEAFTQCPYLRITKKVWVPKGLSSIPSYRRMRALDPGRTPSEKTLGIADAFEEGGVKYQLHRRKERNRKAVERKKEVILAKRGKLACEVCR